MKKIMSAALALSLALTSVSAVFADTAETANVASAPSAEPAVYSISLDEAVQMAYENNAQLEANLLKQKGNEVSRSSAAITQRTYRNMAVNVSSNFDLYCLKNGYYVDAAEMGIRISQMEYEKIKADIAYDVTEAYYNLVLMQKLLNAAENSYNLALDNKKAVDAQYALGLIPELDYENANVTVQSCENALTEYKLNYETAEQNLKILINKDAENCTVIPTDEIECEEYISNPDEDIPSAMETRFDLSSLKETLDLAETYFDLSKALTDESATYNTAYASYMEADYNYTHTQKLIALSIKSAYNKVLTTKANMETSKLQYEIELKKYDASKLKYELGMITNLELTSCINDLYSAQVNYANSKLNYRLAVEKYKYEITIGL